MGSWCMGMPRVGIDDLELMKLQTAAQVKSHSQGHSVHPGQFQYKGAWGSDWYQPFNADVWLI